MPLLIIKIKYLNLFHILDNLITWKWQSKDDKRKWEIVEVFKTDKIEHILDKFNSVYDNSYLFLYGYTYSCFRINHTSKANNHKQVTTATIVWNAFKPELIYSIVLIALSELSEVLSLICVKYIVDWVQGSRSTHFGVAFIVIFIVSTILGVLARNHQFMYSFTLFAKINKGISALLFQKVLRLSQKSSSVVSSGKLVTLVSGELQTIEESSQYIFYVLTKPILLILLFGYLCIDFKEAGAISLGALVWILAAFMAIVGKIVKWKYFEGKSNINYQ